MSLTLSIGCLYAARDGSIWRCLQRRGQTEVRMGGKLHNLMDGAPYLCECTDADHRLKDLNGTHVGMHNWYHRDGTWSPAGQSDIDLMEHIADPEDEG